MRAWMLVLLVAGCSRYEEAEFIPEKTDLFCDLFLECADSSLLVFDGGDKSRCVSVWGPVFQAEQQDCKLVKKSALQCLDALSTATCPNDNATADDMIDALPAVCDLARKKCAGSAVDPSLEDAS